MQKKWHPFWMWEDFQNGMFDEPDDSLIAACAELLCDQEGFYVAASEMVDSWPVAAEENLSNKRCNRRAWVGQATCCFRLRAPERTTRAAWGVMSVDDRIDANNTADRVIDEYSAKSRGLHKPMGAAMLPGWNPRDGASEAIATEQGTVIRMYRDGDTEKRCDS